MRAASLFLILMLFLLNLPAFAQDEILTGQKSIRIIVKDATGEKTEGTLLISPEKLAVSTKDQQEKSIPLMAIRSIRVEKVQQGIPGTGQLTGEEYYSVRLENSHEILTLEKKYTLTLTTSVGLVTKTLDPNLLSKDLSSSANPQTEKPFIRDKSLILSLELKF